MSIQIQFNRTPVCLTFESRFTHTRQVVGSSTSASASGLEGSSTVPSSFTVSIGLVTLEGAYMLSELIELFRVVWLAMYRRVYDYVVSHRFLNEDTQSLT